MNARFDRQEMAEALSAVGSVAAVRTPKPILQCVRIEAHSDHLLLCATDLELGIRYAVNQVEVVQQGETLVSADKFSRIVRESDDDQLVIEQESSLFHVKGADSHFQIVSQDVADFPPVPSIEGESDFTLDFETIRRLIEWTSFAAARENTRYAINGVLWKIDGEKLVLAATDGRRLSKGEGTVTSGTVKLDWQAIVPVKALQLIGRAAADDDAPVGVKMTGNQMLFCVGPMTISTSLVEGRFPDYERVIPSDCEYSVTLGTSEFQSALRRAALLTNEESKGVRLAFAKNRLTLSSRAPEQGEATIDMPIEFDDEPLDMGFNPEFLLAALKVAHADQVSFEFKEQNKPGVIKVNSSLLYVVMPVSLS